MTLVTLILFPAKKEQNSESVFFISLLSVVTSQVKQGTEKISILFKK